MTLKFSPFRRAVAQDPYYLRLTGKNKQKFWKIYSKHKTCTDFKDLFEKLSALNPAHRLEISQIL